MSENRTSHAGEPASARVRFGTNPARRILVVDDDISIRQLSTRVLIHSGYRVDAARDGAIAWQAINTDSYDLLITDPNMPQVSGIELLKKLRAARMGLPVILVSGVMTVEELNRHSWLQLAATLAKPFSGDELLGTVRKVLRATDGARDQIAPPQNWQSPPSADGLQL